MNTHHVSRVRRMRDDESGQSIVLAMVVLFLLFAMAAFSIDMGNLYFCYTKLVSATEAAANAGGTAMSSLTLTASTEAKKYSGSSAVSALSLMNFLRFNLRSREIVDVLFSNKSSIELRSDILNSPYPHFQCGRIRLAPLARS